MVETNARYHIRVNPLTVDQQNSKYLTVSIKRKQSEFSRFEDDVAITTNVLINHNSLLN